LVGVHPLLFEPSLIFDLSTAAKHLPLFFSNSEKLFSDDEDAFGYAVIPLEQIEPFPRRQSKFFAVIVISRNPWFSDLNFGFIFFNIWRFFL
jgi:hypothetical protein